MPRYIVIRLQDHAGIVAADVLADDINHVFQPHYDACVIELDDATSAIVNEKVRDEND